MKHGMSISVHPVQEHLILLEQCAFLPQDSIQRGQQLLVQWLQPFKYRSL